MISNHRKSERLFTDMKRSDPQIRNSRSKFGFLYVMSNEHISQMLKIGQSERHPRTRAVELSAHTGVPADFVVEFWVEVSDRRAAESAVHTALAANRVNAGREFFRIGLPDARLAVSTHAAPWLVSTSAHPSDEENSQTLVNCKRCRSALQFHRLTGPIGGFCICGNQVDFTPGQTFQGIPSGDERGLVLPKCGICRSRMVLEGTPLRLKCTHPKCSYEIEKWR